MIGRWVRVFCIAMVGSLSLPGAEGWAADSAPAGTFQLDYRDGRVSLEASDAALAQILQDLAVQAQFHLVLKGHTSRPVTLSLVEVPLETGLRRLIGDLSAVLIYHPDQPDEAEGPRLRKLLVRGDAPGATLASVPRRLFHSDRLGLVLVDETDPDLRADLAQLPAEERAAAMAWLAGQGGAAAIGALGFFLALDEDPKVRREAAAALERLGGDKVVPAIATGLGDQDPDVRFQAVQALGARAGEPSTMALGQVLFGESDPEIRAQAVVKLAETRTEANRALLESATHDSDPQVRDIAEDLLLNWD